MKKIAIYTILSFSLFWACKNEGKVDKTTSKTIGLLSISKAKPQPGETIEITYKNDNVTEAFYQYLVNTKNYPADIDLESNGREHTGSIKIPDSAQAIAFVFKTGDDYEANNEKGYIIPLYNTDGAQISGSNAAAALYSVRNGNYEGIKADKNEVADILKADLNNDPNLKKDWEKIYLQLAYENNKVEGKKLIDSYLEDINMKTDKFEKDYVNMIEFYSTIGQKSKSDSIKTMVIEKFPKGKTASYESVLAFYDESDIDKQEAHFEKYLEANSKMSNWVSNMATNLATYHFDNGNMENFEKYASHIDNKTNRASMLNNLAWSMAEKGESLDKAEKLSKTSLDLITDLQKEPTDKPEYFTQKQYEKNLRSSYKMYADTYAFILFKQGNIKEAITYQEKAHDPESSDAEANARYISYLMADDQYESVIDKAEKILKLGNGNDDIKSAFKTAYLKMNPNSNDVEMKLEDLKKEGYNKSVEEIKAKLIDEEAPQFTLKNTEGQDITLADLKGKVVILDFWATWCGPCKASFPGMQKVVTKYKDDENVELLFVDTFESGENREQLVEDFIAKNNYDFHVVYDNEIKDSRDFEVAKKYEVDGIPTKVIIGPNGKINFKSVGYSGSIDKLISEMDIMIDILKS
ncbi:TlpA disulfide reductase family protein [Winogradskyella bathintestinalis]|uniref:TlpA disulfide reductase family protein n=1 Tax=Winogradskyella bathintestinalis TaxID=3035208 RepID=A0ABT7ZWW7_9FLAO|nr:TlpA disulfide reductase family protein [Winogradskyella bathintestinalis]MDN3493497.1 TlpA disulfide reductase family protein [Winogradskyella bathintestinalis]